VPTTTRTTTTATTEVFCVSCLSCFRVFRNALNVSPNSLCSVKKGHIPVEFVTEESGSGNTAINLTIQVDSSVVLEAEFHSCLCQRRCVAGAHLYRGVCANCITCSAARPLRILILKRVTS
jgi:hypothetical protein